MRYSILILCVLAVLLIAPVSAGHVIILQGGGETPPVAYLNETVDMSYVLPWSNTIAWWPVNKDPETTLPTLTITVSGFQHSVWLDPTKYRIGMWYKWDGTWEGAGYNEAFEIKGGVRPIETPTITPTVTTTQTVEQKYNETKIILTEGDVQEYSYAYSKGHIGAGHIWLFGTYSGLFDQPMTWDSNTSVYTFTFNATTTESLATGTYFGYVQLNGDNGWQDIGYSALSGNLTSPFKAVHDVNLSGLTPAVTMKRLDTMRNNTVYCDDVFVPVTVKVVRPEIRFTDYYEVDDAIIINGISGMSAGTSINFIIDSGHWVKAQDIIKHTVTTKLTGSLGEERKFSVSIPIDWDEISIGTHVINGTINKYNISLTQSQDFDVTSIMVNPTQTPISQKVITEEYGWHRANKTNLSYVLEDNGTISYHTPSPTPTPIIIYVNTTVYVTPTPTPVQSEPTAVPTETADVEIPLPVEIPVFAVMLVIVYVGMKRRKDDNGK
jgi:hypothetical protein